MMPKNQAIKWTLLCGQCLKSGHQIQSFQFTDGNNAFPAVFFSRSFKAKHIVAKGKIPGSPGNEESIASFFDAIITLWHNVCIWRGR
jgi:hypothetical protein